MSQAHEAVLPEYDVQYTVGGRYNHPGVSGGWALRMSASGRNGVLSPDAQMRYSWNDAKECLYENGEAVAVAARALQHHGQECGRSRAHNVPAHGHGRQHAPDDPHTHRACNGSL